MALISDEDYYPDDYIGYQYPIRPGTEEWASLSNHQEMVDACQIPSHILETMTSEELAQSILAYPLLVDIFAYDDWDIGLEVISSHFNGLTTFESHEDCASTLVAEYASQPAILLDSIDETTALAFQTDDIKISMNADYGVRRDPFFNISLFVLLSNENYYTKLTVVEQEALHKIATQKTILHQSNIIYAPEAFSILSMAESETQASTVTLVTLLKYDKYVAGTATVKTPKNNTVDAYIMKFYERWLGSDNNLYVVEYNDLPGAYKTTINNHFRSLYGLDPISAPTVKYNCHSYAWYMQSTSNPYWIGDPSEYLTDGSYTEVSELGAVAGDSVVYYYSTDGSCTDISHSAIIKSCSQISSTSKLFTLTSKWGMAGLYEHNLYNCPYYYIDIENASNYHTYNYNFYH